jgi:predicted patatin/cPLA2 family phospholipase
MGKNKKNITSHTQLINCAESSQNISSSKVQAKPELEEFMKLTRLKLDTLHNLTVKNRDEYDSVKQEVLMLRSELDKFEKINK